MAAERRARSVAVVEVSALRSACNFATRAAASSCACRRVARSPRDASSTRAAPILSALSMAHNAVARAARASSRSASKLEIASESSLRSWTAMSRRASSSFPSMTR
jgi:hypothetical protein